MTEKPNTTERRRLANAIRFLAIDAVEAAKSGHPGMPMGMADIAEVLWRHHLKHNPENAQWINRDRFLISNGHGSMLQYAALHLTGHKLPLDQLKHFRQLHSMTPGHPERGYTPGIDTTTGPLGQGIANGVGMALAEKLLAARYNRDGLAIVDHKTYVFAGDGCLMEGISHEVASLAGVLGLDKLICYYDDNGISIDGEVEGWFRDDTAARFGSYGWRVIGPLDGHDFDAVDAATQEAQTPCGKPTMIICKTTIGYGSPNKAGKEESHGAALGKDEVAATRKALEWSYGPFEIPDDIYKAWDAKEAGRKLEADWHETLARYAAKYPAEAAEFDRVQKGELPSNWNETTAKLLQIARETTAPVASRKSSQVALETLVPALHEFFGGSADLTGSNLTAVKASKTWHHAGAGSNYLSYGVREFGMAAIMNGLSSHGGIIPYGGTFATFSDYMRSGIRMSALMKLRVIYVLTHDSIGLGEDGPTHQPVEHASALRSIPNFDLWRPCDAFETAIAWKAAIERTDGPAGLFLSRQNLLQQKRDADTERDVERGGYVLSDTNLPISVILIATGSEVGIAMEAQAKLAEEHIGARVVSMPSTNVFDRQDKNYRGAVLPAGIPRAAIEAGTADSWWKYIGIDGGFVGMHTYGESAPAPALYEHFKITTAQLVSVARELAKGCPVTPIEIDEAKRFERSIN